MPAVVGLDSFTLVGITVEGPALPVARALAELWETDLVVQTTGMFGIIAELVCRNDRELLRSLMDSGGPASRPVPVFWNISTRVTTPWSRAPEGR
ncbi:hypothetical protein ACFZDK_26825 [Streptomyces sp. NPDC007901]|uniref:hypothetical protein n=1 Tax=Streptomyces sp. NPDC007901 TaxID=3364785 RepID=UPI0036E0B5C6